MATVTYDRPGAGDDGLRRKGDWLLTRLGGAREMVSREMISMVTV